MMNCNAAHDRSMDHRESLWHSIDQSGYTEYRVSATLHLDKFDSASGRSRHLFLLLSPDYQRIWKTLPRPAPCVHRYLEKPASDWSLWNTLIQGTTKELLTIKRLHQASDEIAGGWHDCRT